MRTKKRRLFVFSIAMLLGASVLARFVREPLLTPEQFGRAVYDRDGTLMRLTLSPSHTYRVFTRLEDISPPLVTATLDYEDKHFFRHPGVNPVALVKAFAFTYVSRDGRRGGSTITMQLAKIKWGAESRSIGGKVIQIAHALQLEWLYSKHDILEAYLNLAPYGGNVEGAGAASLVYFHKAPSALSLPEAMALAVMPQSPTRRTPGETFEPASLRAARLKLATISLAEHPEMRPESLALEAPLTLFTTKQLPFTAPHAVNRALSTREGQTLSLTIDQSMQLPIERLVAQYVARQKSAGIDNATVLVVDVETSEVLAHVGSADFFDSSIGGQVDGASAPRSPGSTLKPLVYARALDEGVIHPLSLLKDVPMRFGSYSPENFDSSYWGPVSATEALVNSRNVPAVALNLRLKRGLHAVLDQVGVKGLRAPDFYGPGIVLGSVEVNQEELTSLYVALAQGGRWSPLRRLVDEPRFEGKRIFSAEAAELTLQMISRDETGSEKLATPRDAVRVAWKTGTSNAFRDAWTVGLAGRYAIAVWVGNFSGEPNPSFSGQTAAAPLFFDVVGALRQTIQSPQGHRKVPTVDLVEIEVCPLSGKSPGPACPHRAHTQAIRGRSPLEACDVHRLVHIDLKTGERRCAAVPGVTRDDVFEVWPSDISRLFAKAGLARRPVPFTPERCEVDGTLTSVPQILSPQPTVTYSLRRDSQSQAHVPLLAHADGSAHRLTWFADDQMIGTVAPGQPIEWSAPSGEYRLRVADEHGNTSEVAVKVQWIE